MRRTVGLGWSVVVPLPLRKGISRQVSAGGSPSASAARGADPRRCPRTLRRRPPPRPASLGRGLARATLAAAGQGCEGRCATWGPEKRAGCWGPREIGEHRLAFDLRPCRGGGALVAAPRPLLALSAWVPAPEVAAGAGSARPLVVRRVGPGPLSLALVGSALHAAGSRSRFLPSSRRHPAAWVKAVWLLFYSFSESHVPAGVPGV